MASFSLDYPQVFPLRISSYTHDEAESVIKQDVSAECGRKLLPPSEHQILDPVRVNSDARYSGILQITVL